ncbi:hypothetical protein B0T22DRAFT_232634 [Podospora appendiculata]|uniref:Uncharacterized protein n=1 Tax=Podospora appendiculata TaxID=314037 RepID=A0AAE0X691_9PEZI|nr:hypothetical protein B0T22DRAFT_232634 [Podospora appendiculata]
MMVEGDFVGPCFCSRALPICFACCVALSPVVAPALGPTMTRISSVTLGGGIMALEMHSNSRSHRLPCHSHSPSARRSEAARSGLLEATCIVFMGMEIQLCFQGGLEGGLGGLSFMHTLLVVLMLSTACVYPSLRVVQDTSLSPLGRRRVCRDLVRIPLQHFALEFSR